MSKGIVVMAIVEGKTEQIFTKYLLAPYLANKMIFMTATQVTKPGAKGGDVRFERIRDDVGRHLKQRSDSYVTTFVAYYGVKEWPDLDKVPSNASPSRIAEIVNNAAKEYIVRSFPDLRAEERFVPYMSIHEFEALLFSDSAVLAAELRITEQEVIDVLKECRDPEAINDDPRTAPSKRLADWSKKKFLKTAHGIAIAKKIGIPGMREKCSLFDTWLRQFEDIADRHQEK